MWLVRVCCIGLAAVFLASCSGLGMPVSSLTPVMSAGISGQAAQWLAENRNSPLRVRAFLTKMPKGGDIHTHLSGAVYAENYLRWASNDQLCVNPDSGAISADDHVPCQTAPNIPVAEAFDNPGLYGNLIDKMSLRNFDYAHRPGHDQFFNAFAKFAGGTKGQMIAELSNRAAKQNIGYLEIMLSVGKSHTKALAKQVGFDGDIDATYNKLMAAGLQADIVDGQQGLGNAERDARSVLTCDANNPQPGCAVERRYLLQINRTGEPDRVFAEMVYAFETVQADPLAVGVNMVAPEDDVVALRDYDLHMRMLQYLAARYPSVPVSLHAGELTLGLVPPEELHDHIRKAVEMAGAKRIGHGVDVMYEDSPFPLLKEMQAKHVLVEICLTSNDAILGVKGKQHPFPEYLKAGVPATLASDDEGISRIDLTHEYERAALDYGLGYPELKTLARNSVHYSFLRGDSLWADPAYRQMQSCSNADFPAAGAACQRFLDGNDKAKQEWRLEKQFRAFENGGWM